MVSSRRCSLRVAAGLFVLWAGGPAAAQTPASYFEFLMARRLEAQGEEDGALEALERAVAADPASAEIRAEVASFQFRRSRNTEAETAALRALELDDQNQEAHRVLGLIQAASVDAMTDRKSVV